MTSSATCTPPLTASNLAVPLSLEPLRGSIVTMSGAGLAAGAAVLGAAEGAAAAVAGGGLSVGIGIGDIAGALAAGGAAESTFCGPPQAKTNVAQATIELS